MNHWTELSIEYANQRNYLDELYTVYPIAPEGIRDINDKLWGTAEESFNQKNNVALIKSLLKMKLFPIKDSYVAYIRKDPRAIERNPQTINRLCGRLYDIGLNEILERCTEPKETNRQIGPLFKRWLAKGTLGVPLLNTKNFLQTRENAILDASDAESMIFANRHLGYNRNKGLDFVARFNNKYIIGEAKFLTDFGGHQGAQFEDAISTLQTDTDRAIKIAILDGVLYITPKRGNKIYNFITSNDVNIMSALVLREFLYQV
jgi:hypothetical protein